MGRAARVAAVALVVLATVGCDRVTKRLASAELQGRPARSYLSGTVRLVYAENPGAFLGLGGGLPPALRTGLLTVAPALVLGALALLPLRARTRFAGWVGLALVWSGGASNLWDRLWRGSVVDFLSVGLGPVRTGIFNVADVAIMAGVALVLVAFREPAPAAAPEAPAA